jgi:hypothetical protein
VQQQLIEARNPALDLRLSRDASEYQRIANDPSVLPFIVQKGVEAIDLTSFFDDGRNLGFLFHDCAFLVHWLEPSVYEVHSMALPHVRGRCVYDAATTAIRFMFFATDAMELLTRVVDGNVGATALTRKVRFSPEFTRSSAWETEKGPRDVHFYAMRYPEWIKHQDWLMARGEEFHVMLGDEVEHGHDPAHDLYVGAAFEMVLSGQPDKGCFLYNRWARFAGYEAVDIVSREPLTIDIKSHSVTLENGKITVASCR